MNGTFIRVSNLTQLEDLKEDILELTAKMPVTGLNGNLMEYLEGAVKASNYDLIGHVGAGKLNGVALVTFGEDLGGHKSCKVLLAVSKYPAITKKFMLDLENVCREQGVEKIIMQSEVDGKLYSRWARQFGFGHTFTGVTKELTNDG